MRVRRARPSEPQNSYQEAATTDSTGTIRRCEVTVVIPTRKILPEGGEQRTVGEGSTLSVALTLNVTMAPSRLVAVVVILPGSDKMGAVTSAKLAVVALAALEYALRPPGPLARTR